MRETIFRGRRVRLSVDPVSQRVTATHCRKHSACRFVELGPALTIRAPPPPKKRPATTPRRQRCGAKRENTHEQHRGRWFGRGGGNSGGRSDRTAGTEASSIRQLSRRRRRHKTFKNPLAYRHRQRARLGL